MGCAPGEPSGTGRSRAAAQGGAAADRDSLPVALPCDRDPICQALDRSGRDHCDHHRGRRDPVHARRHPCLPRARCHAHDDFCRGHGPRRRPSAGSQPARSSPCTRSIQAARPGSSHSRRQSSKSAGNPGRRYGVRSRRRPACPARARRGLSRFPCGTLASACLRSRPVPRLPRRASRWLTQCRLIG